ncbi:hypothetical protein OROMI_004586 [Orobanche minor]
MGWKVRTPDDFIPPGKLTPDYGGGEISHIDWCSQDEMSSLELGFMLGEIGAVYGVLEYYYSPDSRDHCVNIIQIVGDREAIEMCKFVDGDKLVGVVVSQSTLTNQTMSSLDVVETQSTLLDIIEPLDYLGGDEQDEFEDSESEDSGQDDEQVGDENIAKSNENVEEENIYSGILDSVYDFENSGGSDWKVTCGEDSVLSDPIFDSDYQLCDDNAVREYSICEGRSVRFSINNSDKVDTKDKAKCANQGESKKTSKKKLKTRGGKAAVVDPPPSQTASCQIVNNCVSVQAKQAAAASRVQSRARKNAPAPTTKGVVPSKRALPPKNTNILKKQDSLPKKTKTTESYGEVAISLAQ